MKIKAKEIVLFPTSKLVPYPKNANVHTQEQIDEMIKLINFYGHRDPLIVDIEPNEDGFHEVIAGCGRLEAAKQEEWENLPVIFQPFKSPEEKYGFHVSHNAINSKDHGGGLDLSKINIDIIDFGPELEINMLGIKNFTVEPLENIDDISDILKDDFNKKFLLEIQFPNDMEMMDIHDDLLHRGYMVKIK